MTPLQVNHSIHTWDKIKHHIQGVWDHSDLSLDITNLHQEIHDMSEGEKQFSTQNVASDLFNNLAGYVGHASWTTFFFLYNLGVSIFIFVLVLLLLLVIFRLLKTSISQLSTKFHTFVLKN